MDDLITIALILIFISRIGAIRSRSRTHGGTPCHDSNNDFLDKRHDRSNIVLPPVDHYANPHANPYDAFYENDYFYVHMDDHPNFRN